MTTTGRRCAGCGSPLPETPAPTRLLTCAFCGLVNDFAHGAHPPGQAPVTVHVDVGRAVESAATVGRTAAWVVFLSIAVVIGAVLFGVYVAMRPVSDAIKTATDQVAQFQSQAIATPPRPQKLAPGDLAALGQVGWKELDVPTPSSGWAAFEPVTDLGWAMAMAKAWQSDARLTRIDIERATPGGTIDLTAGPANSAGYRFVSPGQIESYERIADRDSNATVGSELMIKLAEQKATALIVRGKPTTTRELPPTDIATHPLPELIALAKKSPGFTEHPFYKGYMIHLEREGWVWYLQSLSGRESLPRVRARDGAVFPYRR